MAGRGTRDDAPGADAGRTGDAARPYVPRWARSDGYVSGGGSSDVEADAADAIEAARRAAPPADAALPSGAEPVHVQAMALGGLGGVSVLLGWFFPTSPVTWASLALVGGLGLAWRRSRRVGGVGRAWTTTGVDTLGDVDSLVIALPLPGEARAVGDVDDLAGLADALCARGEAHALFVLRAPGPFALDAVRTGLPEAPLRAFASAPLGDDGLVVLVPARDLELMAAPFVRFLDGVVGKVAPGTTLRAGVALAPGDAPTALDVIDLAARAADGVASGLAYHDAASLEALRERDELRRELRRALAAAEIVAHYQPVVDRDTLRVVGAEALVRWAHPEHGLLPPGRFLPLVEDQGATMDLTGRLLAKACRRAIAWRRTFDPNFTVFVNLSRAQLRDAWLPSMVEQVLQRSGVPPEALAFEVELADVRGSQARARHTVELLRALGCGVVVDGVGTVDDLAALAGLRPDAVKIDARRLGVAGDGFLGRRATDVGEAAAELGARVLVKRVETPGQLQALRSVAGVHGLQGFALAPPLHRSGFEALAAGGDPTGVVLGTA